MQHTYDRIKQSARHHVIAEVYNGSIVERYFPDWQMACRKVLPGSIVELSAQRWSRTRLALWSAGNKPEPVSRLLEFWEGPCGRQLMYDQARVNVYCIARAPAWEAPATDLCPPCLQSS